MLLSCMISSPILLYNGFLELTNAYIQGEIQDIKKLDFKKIKLSECICIKISNKSIYSVYFI